MFFVRNALGNGDAFVLASVEGHWHVRGKGLPKDVNIYLEPSEGLLVDVGDHSRSADSHTEHLQ